MNSRAFTLIEMLVAMAILALLSVFIAQIVSMSSSAIAASSRKLDSASDMRFVLDRIGMDLASRVRRSDVPLSFDKKDGNDEFALISEVEGYNSGAGANRKIAAVSYRMGKDSNAQLQLRRGVSGTQWGLGAGVPFQANSVPVVPDNNFDRLGDAIVRIEVNYLMNDGTIKNSYAKIDDVVSIIVTVAGIDAANRKVLTADDIDNISRALPDSVNGQDTLVSWQTALNGGTGALSKSRALEGLRFSQRYYDVR